MTNDQVEMIADAFRSLEIIIALGSLGLASCLIGLVFAIIVSRK